MKSYIDLEQSKKLAEILPLESADMYFTGRQSITNPKEWEYRDTPEVRGKYIKFDDKRIFYPCWSLAALLCVLPFHIIVNNQRYAFGMYKGLNRNGETYMFRYNIFNTDVCLYETDYYNNPVDACYEMIEKLHELNLL